MTIRQRLLEVLLSRSDYRRLCDYPVRNGQRLSSDYRRANPAPKFFQTFQKLFKNPIRIFSKPFEKSSGFSARWTRGCRGGTASARGDSAGLETAGSPPGRAWSAAGGDLAGRRRALAVVRARHGQRRVSTAQGLGGVVQVIRGQRSDARRAAGLAVRRAAAAADAAVSLLLRSGGLCRGRCTVGRCNTAVGCVRGHCGVFMAWDRYLYPLA